MNKYKLLVILLVILYSNVLAQHSDYVNSSLIRTNKGKQLLLGINLGLKYTSTKDANIKALKENETSACLSLNVGVNPFNNIEHTIGFEFLLYKYGKSKDKFIENVIGLNLYYRRSFYTTDHIFFFPQATINVISNDPALMLSNSLDLGMGYSNDNFEILLKNSFRFNIFNLQQVPSTLLLGFQLKLN
jgi:hypothetical protein